MAEIFALSLGMTLVAELIYGWLWGIKGWDYLLIVLMNILTNPAVVAWHYGTLQMGLLVSTVLPESAAVMIECLLLKQFGKQIRKPLIFGICINIFSYFTGMIVNLLIF